MRTLRGLLITVKAFSLSTLGPIMAAGDIGLRIEGGLLGCPFFIPFILCQTCPTPCRFLSILPWLFTGMIASGFTAGSIFCGLVCPLGTLSGALYRAPLKKLAVKARPRLRSLSYMSLILLLYISYEAVRILLGSPITGLWSFFITFRGGLTALSVSALLILLAMSVFIYRPWCRFVCPFGAALRLFNRFSLLSLRIDASRCVGCNPCTSSCPLGLTGATSQEECIRCLTCYSTCRNRGVKLVMRHPIKES